MKLNVTFDEQDLKNLVYGYIAEMFPGIILSTDNIHFLVKSKNNYKPQEWEDGQLKIEINHYQK